MDALQPLLATENLVLRQAVFLEQVDLFFRRALIVGRGR
jgi:hypothetical protein